MLKKVIKWVLIVVVALVLVVFLAFQLSPWPGVWVVQQVFNAPVEIKDPDKYAAAEKNVKVEKNIQYKSDYQDNIADLYFPKTSGKKVPIVFWVHGGGYVAGDKGESGEFATYLVDSSGVAVISINYELAPKLHYPGQVTQLADAYTYFKENAEKYPFLDFSRVFFGGDSAGAQIAAQFTALQTNPDYAKEMDFSQIVSKDSIKGVISYCGPLDLKQMAEKKRDSRFMSFFVKTVAWSLIGTKNWQENPKLFEGSVVDHITKDFPPSYVVDGNTYSFPLQGIAFVEKLKELNVPVDSLFYQDTKKEIVHEFQFKYETDEAKQCLEETLAFINQYGEFQSN